MGITHTTSKVPGDRVYAVSDWNAGHSYTISHTELTGIGTNTHSQIDLHIADTSIHPSDANLVHKTGNEAIAGIKTFSSFPVSPSASPTLDYQLTPKIYVDSFAAGLTWKPPVATFADLATTYPDPEVGWAALVLDTSKGYVWDGSAWIQFNAQQEYTASLGVKKVVNDFQLDLSDTNPCLEIADGGVRVVVDDSSIERSGSGLEVKALGITNAMLAGSIADSKLNQITTAGKVSGAALTALNNIPGGASQVPVANLGTGAPDNTKYLRGDGTWQVPPAGSVSAAAQYFDVDVVSASQTAQSWTNMPPATTELFANTYSRIKANLSNVSQYRLVVNQSVAGAAGADLNLQYSTDNVTYLAADTAGAGEVDVGTGTGVKVGAWADLVAGAEADVWLRIVGKQGNNSADPAWRQIRIQFYVPGQAGIEHGIEFIIDGAGSAITTGVKGDLEVPFNCTIQSATLLADQTGDIIIDIWKDTYSNFPPDDTDSITAAAPPTISAGVKSQDSTLTGWTTSLSKGETLRFNVDSAATITRVTLSLKVSKT